MPPIRYPLPTLIALTFLGLIVWRGEALTRTLRSTFAARIHRAVEGPPVVIPSSTTPQIVAGPITRKALLLHDDVAATDKPGGEAVATIRLRMFVEVYDVWPPPRINPEPTHYRVGNRRPIGWVAAPDVLPWNTRLVVRERDGGTTSLPVVSWSKDAIEVVRWGEGEAWKSVSGRENLAWSAAPAERWGVWLSRQELLSLLGRALSPSPSHSSRSLRARAVLGKLLDDQTLNEADVAAARDALPALVFDGEPSSLSQASERLARINENWTSEASWGGISFGFVPLSALP